MLEPLFHPSVLVVVAAAAGLMGLWAGMTRWWAGGRAPPPQAGLPFLIAAVGGLLATGNANRWLAVALGLLLLAGWLLAKPSWAGLGGCALVAGAALLGFGPQHAPGPPWVRAGLVAATPAVAWALASFDRRQPSLTLPLLVLAAAGIYVTAPDTEQSRVVLGAAAGVCAVGWWLAARLGTMATPAVAGLLLWTVALGGRGRHAALIGAFGCLGILVVEPLSSLAPIRRPRSGMKWGRWGRLAALGLFQAGIVVGCHRAGRIGSAAGAAAGVAVTAALSAGILVLWRPAGYPVKAARMTLGGSLLPRPSRD